MGVIKAKYNDAVTFDPTAGNDAVLIESTGGAVSFPLQTDGKYMFVATMWGTTAENDLHFNVHAGESSMGAWQQGRGDIHLYALETTRTCSTDGANYNSTDSSGAPYDVVLGPFESARIARAATSTDNDIESVGDTCIRLDFVAVASSISTTEFPTTETEQTASAEVKLFKLPEIEYTT